MVYSAMKKRSRKAEEEIKNWVGKERKRGVWGYTKYWAVDTEYP